MRKFKDAEGREWSVRINVTSLKEVKDGVNIDLLDIGDPEAGSLMRLYSDPILMIGVVYVLCEAQAKEREITPEDFGRAMYGDVLAHAYEAITEELADFSPNRKQRELIHKVMQKVKAAEERLTDLMDVKVESPAMDAAIEREVRKAEAEIDQRLSESGSSSTSVPGSSESIPVPSPSENSSG